jgi:hypothetical protein
VKSYPDVESVEGCLAEKSCCPLCGGKVEATGVHAPLQTPGKVARAYVELEGVCENGCTLRVTRAMPKADLVNEAFERVATYWSRDRLP